MTGAVAVNVLLGAPASSWLWSPDAHLLAANEPAAAVCRLEAGAPRGLLVNNAG